MYFSLISTALKAGDTAEIRRLTAEALQWGHTPEQIINQSLIPAMDEVGKQFRGSEIFIPEVLKAARAMHGGIRILQKNMDKSNENKSAKVLIGTVAGDLHDIGKSLVSMFIDARGYQVVNLGIDVPTEDFIWAVRKQKPEILAMSALLTTTMPAMQEVINELKNEGLRDKVKVLVGGGPVTQKFAEEIGADGYAYDAKAAADWISERFPII